jgi:DNA-directed DNA polymerase III epsilon subunit
MTALVYQQFLEFDQGRTLLEEQENFSTNPFGGLDLSGFFDE